MDHRKHGIIYQEKYRTIMLKRKWTYREYHFKDNADVAHEDMKMYCDTNQFSAVQFGVLHPKHHGARGFINHYHLRFDPKLGHGIYEIRRIPCACAGCTSMLDKYWISGIPTKI